MVLIKKINRSLKIYLDCEYAYGEIIGLIIRPISLTLNPLPFSCSFEADLAQLVEPHICNMFVIGSNPIVGSIFNEKKQKEYNLNQINRI